MKMRDYSILILIMLTFAFSFPVGAQQNETEKTTPKEPATKRKYVSIEYADEPAVIIAGQQISLTDAIKKAIEQNHDIVSGSYDVAMSDTAYEQFKKKYAIFFDIDAGAGYNEYPPSMVYSNGSSSKKYDITGSVSKSFSTGTTVTAGMQHNYADITSDSTPGYQGLALSHTPVLFVSIQQELLKNALGYNDFKTLAIQKNQARIQRETILQNLSIVVLGVIADYWNLILKKTEFENSQLQLAETFKVRRIIRRNVKIGLADNYQLNFYNNLVAQAEANTLNAGQEYRVALRSFLTTINMEDSVQIGNSIILSDRKIPVNVEDALKVAFSKRADYISAKLNVRNAEMQLGIYKNEDLPSLTAEFNAQYMGQDNSMSTAMGDTTTMEYPNYEVRLKMTYPLNDTAQKANKRNARYKLKQAIIQLDKTSRDIKDDINNKAEQIETSYKVYQKTRAAQTQAWLYYRRMKANLLRGRLSAHEVKGGLDTWIIAKQAEINALVGYNVALLQFEVAQNRLFNKFKIDVDKYIPKN